MRKLTYTILGLSLTAASAVSAKDKSMDLGIIDVVAVTPLQDSGVAASKIPANIQTVSSEQLEKAQSISLADYINRYLGSVHINEAQNNLLQPGHFLSRFRRFTAAGIAAGIIYLC